MALPPRKIGNDLVNPIGFGAMGISAFYGKIEPDEERFKVSGKLDPYPFSQQYTRSWMLRLRMGAHIGTLQAFIVTPKC